MRYVAILNKGPAKMSRLLTSLVLATGFAAPLFKYPVYAAVIFTFTILYTQIFPSTRPNAEVLLLPTKKPYLAGLKPLDDPTLVQGDHCPTCWDELDATNAPTKLACGHVFCNEDIKDWINSGKSTCPVCKKVLFQQPMFQGNDAIKEKVHKARVCLVAMNLLLTILRQICAFIARHPDEFVWNWNPIHYLTGYGSLNATISALTITIFDIGSLFFAWYGFKLLGSEWFRLTSGHWGWWLAALFTSASNFNAELDKSRHFIWIAWRICLWRWQGSPGSFLFWDTAVAPVLERGLGERSEELVVELTAAWDKFGRQIV
jgi:hypothetical protein